MLKCHFEKRYNDFLPRIPGYFIILYQLMLCSMLSVLGGIWKEAIMHCSNVLFCYLPGKTEELRTTDHFGIWSRFLSDVSQHKSILKIFKNSIPTSKRTCCISQLMKFREMIIVNSKNQTKLLKSFCGQNFQVRANDSHKFLLPCRYLMPKWCLIIENTIILGRNELVMLINIHLI